MAVGLAAILTAVALVVYNRTSDILAGHSAADILRQVEQQLPRTCADAAAAAPTNAAADADGSSCIGVLELPSLNLSLPVQRDWSYPALRRSPCRYTGSAADSDLIIAGHNYNTHFGRLKELCVGDAVRFTEVDGKRHSYTVSAIETIEPFDQQGMHGGDWDLTLFTCTLGGQHRVTVRCTQDT